MPYPTKTSASDIWTLKDVYAARDSDTFPRTPDAPTNVSATAGDAQAEVSFTAPSDNGGSAITSFRVTSSPEGITATGSSSPITVTGLTNGTAYTFTVAAQNQLGFGPESTASSSVTPQANPTVVVQVWGASGGPGRGGHSAGGGYATATFTAPSDTVLTYVVGAGGSSESDGTGVYGGAGGDNSGSGGAGGGFSGIFLGGSDLAQDATTQGRAIAIAGGSGGGGNDGYGSAPGGAGGGTTGGDASAIESPSQGLGGQGGTQSQGGNRGSGGNQDGGRLKGGGAGAVQDTGGGGGGYYGGGSGGTNSSYDAAGGGGSGFAKGTGSFTADGETINVTSASTTAASNAQASQSAGSNEAGYSTGVGASGSSGQVRITVDDTVVIDTTTVNKNSKITYTIP